MMIKFIDLFAGIGGFRYGIQKLGIKSENSSNNQSAAPQHSERSLHCVYSNEWDKYANSVYRKHFGACDNRDIREVGAKEIPDFDLLCGGFPCQSFSVAGKRAGFLDTRGTLFFEIARIIREKQPRLLFLENVKGLLNHDQGRTFEIILSTLDELGYDAQWQVLNSKDFGVPQNRERVYIVGHLRGTPRPQVFPITENGERNDFSTSKEKQTSFCVTTRGGSRLDPTAENFIANTLSTRQNAPSSTQRRSHENYIAENFRIRRLTPTECERLQGFPDNWTAIDADNKLVSDTQRYKMLGNAVTTNVITAIAKSLFKV